MNLGELNLDELKRKWRCFLSVRRLKDLVVVCGKACNDDARRE
jgi:hypothetical protein